MKYTASIILILLSSAVLGGGIENSAVLGNALTEAVTSKSSIKLKKLGNYKEIKSFLKENKCSGFKYRAYSLVGKSKFYLVASKGKSVIIGRHFVGDIKDGVVDIGSLVSSTKGCINLGRPKKDSAAMFVTHLKLEPNEFHVLESNLANVALYVSAKKTLFSVSKGSINKVEE